VTIKLRKRIITSIILFIIAMLCIAINQILFIGSSIVIAIISFVEWGNINRLNEKRALKSFIIIVPAFIYLFVILQFSSFSLRGNSFESIFFFIIILCICICSDIGGYVSGKIIGGKKLTKISPNKTISGSLGSFIFAMFPLFFFNFQNYIEISFSFSLQNILLCLIISLVCQLGDLFISYFKRLNKIKNSGTILPGHGGLLDRIDGIIFVIPAVYSLKILHIF